MVFISPPDELVNCIVAQEPRAVGPSAAVFISAAWAMNCVVGAMFPRPSVWLVEGVVGGF